MYTLYDSSKDILLHLYESLFPSQYLSFRQSRMLKLIDNANRHVCQRDTDLCVEGFPRSANSFTAYMLRQANPDAKIVSHSHLVDNVKLAIAYEVPTVVLIRDPIQTVASYCVFKHPVSHASSLLNDWISYYSYITKIREKVAIIDFKVATKDVNLVIEKLNEMYQKEFKLVEDLEHSKGEFFAAKKAKYMKGDDKNVVRRVSIPVQDRDGLKAHYVALLEKHPKKETALEIYNNLISV